MDITRALNEFLEGTVTARLRSSTQGQYCFNAWDHSRDGIKTTIIVNKVTAGYDVHMKIEGVFRNIGLFTVE